MKKILCAALVVTFGLCSQAHAITGQTSTSTITIQPPPPPPPNTIDPGYFPEPVPHCEYNDWDAVITAYVNFFETDFRNNFPHPDMDDWTDEEIVDYIIFTYLGWPRLNDFGGYNIYYPCDIPWPGTNYIGPRACRTAADCRFGPCLGGFCAPGA